VPGTGGTRDVLAQYNVSYASGNGSNGGAGQRRRRNVYAIVPGVQSPVAAYDPMFAQTLQPGVASNGTPTTTTATLDVGQAGLHDAIGKAVYLSGVPGLKPGYYTLLPGKYATLPGAYRVTVSGTGGNVVPGATQVRPDGTVTTAGYFADAVTGGRSATPTLFDVQSGATWQQYSQYTLKGANDFFAAQAAKQGNVTPPLPVDGGQLVLAATKALALGATLNAAPGALGAPAEVDIASRDIQITGSGSAALAGYLQIGSDALDSLNAGSLLIGGTRAATANGVTITPIANSVVVSNDAGSSLKGPEILIATRTDAGGTDPNAANGARRRRGIDRGGGRLPGGQGSTDHDRRRRRAAARIERRDGAAHAQRRDRRRAVDGRRGRDAVGRTGAAARFVRHAEGRPERAAVGQSDHGGRLGDHVHECGRRSLAGLPGFVIDPSGLAQFANADLVSLRSYGAMGFIGDVNATFGKHVDLSAGTFTSDGGRVTLNGQQIAFTNETGAPNGAVTPGRGTLTVNAQEIDFGAGTKSLSGFASANLSASAGIVGQGTGTFDFGALPVTLNAPVYLADTRSASTVKTAGALTLNSAAGAALPQTPVGGAWHFVGATLADNGATIAAPAGNVSLEATTGNLTIGSGSTVSSAGVSKQFFDVTQYAPAGSITLTADAGTVDLQPGATLDFSGAKGGGAAGSLTLSAPKQVVNLNGTIKGGAASGYAGGSLSLDTAGAADLDALAKTLASSGVNQSIDIHTRSGNLTLSAGNALSAHAVSLTADGGASNASDAANGNVDVLGTIDASGKAGGQISLYGKSGVDIEGSLLAKATDASQRGGKVAIGTSATFDPAVADPYNASYGYENVSAAQSGAIRLGSNASIDVSGGTPGGTLDGTVDFRAPLLRDGTVNVVLDGSRVRGSRKTTVEAYAVWSTADATTGSQHFDGLVDPAGWYDGSGHLLAGTFTVPGSTPATYSYTPGGAGGGTLVNDATGESTAVTEDQLRNGISGSGFTRLSGAYFAAAAANADHVAFYGYRADASGAAPGTLMAFVQHGPDGVAGQFAAASLQNFSVAPGIELANPGHAVNGGNISVLSNWNLGAGAPNNSGSITPDFRYRSTIAPTLTFRAANDFDAYASISDGFYQSQVASILGGSGPATATGTYTDAKQQFDQLVSLDDPTQVTVTFTNGGTAGLTSLDPNAMLVSPLTGQTGGYYSAYLSYTGAWQQDIEAWTSPNSSSIYTGHILPVRPSVTPAPVLADHSTYSDYLTAYWGSDLTSGPAPGTYMNGYTPRTVTSFGTPAAPTPPTGLAANATLSERRAYLADYANYMLAYSRYFNRRLPSLFTPPVRAYNVFYAPIAPSSVPDTGVVNIGALPGNAAANVPTANNPLPVAFATLLGSESSSYRIVSGADVSSANPLALQPASTSTNAAAASANLGNVVLSGTRATWTATA
jgi:hypothetical protein